jgi:hypothetical protein
MSKRKSNNFSTILSSFIILLLVAGVIGFLFVFTDNFTTPLKNFYVTCGNDDFIADRENFGIVVGKEYKFEITTNINVSGTDAKYIVSLVPNETSTTTFSYTANGTQKNFGDLESLIKGFSVVAYDDYFILVANMDLKGILEIYHPTQTLENVPTALNSDLPYFRLVIQSADLSETININFNIKSE